MPGSELLLIRNPAPVDQYLETQGMRRYELAERLGVSASQVSQWLGGKLPTSMENIEQMAKLVGCNPWTLILPPHLRIVSEWEAAFSDALKAYVARLHHGQES